MRKLFAAAAAAALVCALAPLPRSAHGRTGGTGPAPQSRLYRRPNPIPDSYIVVLDERVVGPRGEHSRAAAVADELIATYGGRVEAVYSHALQGFSASMSEEAAAALSRNPRVAYVAENAVVRATQIVQANPPWNLDRIDERARPLDGFYSIPRYSGPGSAVHVYVLDTGIRTAHAEFAGRASVAADFVGGGQNGQDCNGHGTHVAATVGGSTYGVAKGVRLHSVRVLNCNGDGSSDWVVRGVDWVTANHVKPAVANVSLAAGGIVPEVDTAVQNSINAGVIYVLSAGNGTLNDGVATDACKFSPGRVAAAMTVASTNSADARAPDSNYGPCIDFFAPGVNILSAWYTSNTATMPLSGTSQAAPHVAGAAVLYLVKDPNASPSKVRYMLANKRTQNAVTNPGPSTLNWLIHSVVTPNWVDTGAPLTGSTGTLSGDGDADYWPFSGNPRGSAPQAIIRGPSTGADFDLFLQQWNGTAWVTLAASAGTHNTYEQTHAALFSGSYRWVVYSYYGSGTYTIQTRY